MLKKLRIFTAIIVPLFFLLSFFGTKLEIITAPIYLIGLLIVLPLSFLWSFIGWFYKCPKCNRAFFRPAHSTYGGYYESFWRALFNSECPHCDFKLDSKR